MLQVWVLGIPHSYIEFEYLFYGHIKICSLINVVYMSMDNFKHNRWLMCDSFTQHYMIFWKWDEEGRQIPI